MADDFEDMIARMREREREWFNTEIWTTPDEIRHLKKLHAAVVLDPENAPPAEIIMEHSSDETHERRSCVYVDRDGHLGMIEYETTAESRRICRAAGCTPVAGRQSMKLGEAQQIFEETQPAHLVSKIPDNQKFNAGVLVRGPVKLELPTQISVDDIMMHLCDVADAEVFAEQACLLEYIKPALCALVEHIAVTYCAADTKKARQAFLDSVTPRMRWAARLVLPYQRGEGEKQTPAETSSFYLSMRGGKARILC